MWLDNVKELKKRTGIKNKEIAAKANLSEKTVENFFAGVSKSPSMDTAIKIIRALGGSLDEIFAETGAVIGNKKLEALQEERDNLAIDLAEERAETAKLRTEIQILTLKLEHKNEILLHKDKIIAMHERNNTFPSFGI